MLKQKLILWPPDAKTWLTGKDPDAGKDWRQEKGMAKGDMVGWHHQYHVHEFEWAPGVGDGQGSWHAAVHGVAKSQTRLFDWTDWSSWTETFVVRSVPFHKEIKDILLSTTWGHCRKKAICWPGRGTLLGTMYLGTLILDFSVSRTVRNKCLLFQQHNSWYSLIAAWED